MADVCDADGNEHQLQKEAHIAAHFSNEAPGSWARVIGGEVGEGRYCDVHVDDEPGGGENQPVGKS